MGFGSRHESTVCPQLRGKTISSAEMKRSEGEAAAAGWGGARARRTGGGNRAKKDVQIVRRHVCVEAFGVGTYLARRAHVCKAGEAAHTATPRRCRRDNATGLEGGRGGNKNLDTDQWTSIFSRRIFGFLFFFHPLPEMETQLTGARMLHGGGGGWGVGGLGAGGLLAHKDQ